MGLGKPTPGRVKFVKIYPQKKELLSRMLNDSGPGWDTYQILAITSKSITYANCWGSDCDKERFFSIIDRTSGFLDDIIDKENLGGDSGWTYMCEKMRKAF